MLPGPVKNTGALILLTQCFGHFLATSQVMNGVKKPMRKKYMKALYRLPGLKSFAGPTAPQIMEELKIVLPLAQMNPSDCLGLQILSMFDLIHS